MVVLPLGSMLHGGSSPCSHQFIGRVPAWVSPSCLPTNANEQKIRREEHEMAIASNSSHADPKHGAHSHKQHACGPLSCGTRCRATGVNNIVYHVHHCVQQNTPAAPSAASPVCAPRRARSAQSVQLPAAPAPVIQDVHGLWQQRAQSKFQEQRGKSVLQSGSGTCSSFEPCNLRTNLALGCWARHPAAASGLDEHTCRHACLQDMFRFM